jgi:hypothetical protein
LVRAECGPGGATDVVSERQSFYLCRTAGSRFGHSVFRTAFPRAHLERFAFGGLKSKTRRLYFDAFS